ncbi:MAG: EamA family transporter [Candidatus Aenigmarchaeota archaeon]|nr:EamA family transporter [Candidatus Aenigmarchaeota archaeon]
MEVGGKKMNVLIIVGLCVICGVLGQLFQKKGMNEIGQVSIKELFSPKILNIVFQKYVFIGISFYGLASILWLAALSKGELSKIYPLIGTGYVFTAILAWLFLGEKLTVMRIAGIFLISIGAYFTALT